MTKASKLIDILKNDWISNWQACYMLKSSNADREIRRIREKPPEGYKVEERPKTAEIDGRKIYYKEFRLVKEIEG